MFKVKHTVCCIPKEFYITNFRTRFLGVRIYLISRRKSVYTIGLRQDPRQTIALVVNDVEYIVGDILSFLESI